MRISIDDGSANIKVLWEQNGRTFTYISPSSFKRGQSVTFGSGKPFNYTVDNEEYSFDLITPDALPTNNIDWQYDPLSSIAVHHALLASSLEPQDIEIVVTLPLTEFYNEDTQYHLDNIERRKKSLLRDVRLNKSVVFNITKVTVRPEPIPAGISLCGKLKPSHSVLVIDLGGITLDISTVAGQMTSVSRIYGDPELGVSLMTDAVKLALARASTDTSSYNVDQVIINRHDEKYLVDSINDPNAVSEVKKVINNSVERPTTRVLTMIDSFKGYSHAIVIDGGAPLAADTIRERMGLRKGRFVMAEEPQLVLVRGLKITGQGTSMTLDRRKVLVYLRLDINTSGRFADAKIETHHRGGHGDVSRTTLLAGLALGEVDSRLPSMLAALLAEDAKPGTLHEMLASFLEIQPASLAPVAASAAASARTPEPPAPVSENVSACNPAGSLPG